MLITIGTPHSGYFVPQYVNSLARTLLATYLPDGFNFEVVGHESCYVHSGRNQIFNACNGDYLMFIDSDMAWNPEDIVKLVRTEKDIVGGLYYKRLSPYGPVVYTYDGAHFKPVKQIKDRLFRCDGIGTGFLLISRKVIDLFKHPENTVEWGYAFDPIKVESPGQAGSFFMGEDLSFCGKARHLGFEIWCDPETVVTHVGRQEVRGPL